mgnify:CR=1 FL=1
MGLIKFALQPGVNKSETVYKERFRYVDTQAVRFFNGLLEKLGGWAKYYGTAIVGKGRDLFPWQDDDGNSRVAIGTSKKLYYLYAGVLTDITPRRSSGTLANNPLVTTSGSAVVEVTHTNHGAAACDYVTLGGATAVGGITPDGEYAITTIIGPDTYRITHSANATSSATGGGASVTYAYQISIGLDDSIDSHGYGVGTYSGGTYSGASSSTVTLHARTWSLAVRGEDLFASPRGGSIYRWQPGDVRATVLTNATLTNVGMFVTADGMVVAVGAGGNKRRVDWADQDAPTTWTPAITNTAGTKTIEIGGEIIDGCADQRGVNLVYTEMAAIAMQRVTTDFVFDWDALGEATGLIGPNAHAHFLSRSYWMSNEDFLMFDGRVQPIPNSSDIRQLAFADINETQRAKFHAGVNAKFSEIWFFFAAMSCAI